MTRRKSNNALFDELPPAPKSPKRMSVRLFTVLRNRIDCAPINVPQPVVTNTEQDQHTRALRKALTKMPKGKLVDYLMNNHANAVRSLTGIDWPWREKQRQYARDLEAAQNERQALRQAIDDAELQYLAGDNQAGIDLIEKITAHIGTNNT